MISNLAQLVAYTESNNNPQAVRHEPEYQPRSICIVGMQQLCKCSFDTARTLCAMSWGKYQIMGSNLISMGLDITPMEFCCDNDYQNEYFQRYIGTNHISWTLEDIVNDESKRKLFARLYNGPGNVDAYAARLMQVYAENNK